MKVFKEHKNIRLAYLFGSTAKKRTHRKSDIDIAVLLEDPVKNRLETKLALLEILQKQFGEKVDMTLLNGAGSLLKYQVVRDGRLLYEKEKGFHKKFYLNSLKEYFDFQPTLDFFYKKTA